MEFNLEKLVKLVSILNTLLIIAMMIISLFVDIFMKLEYFIMRGYIMLKNSNYSYLGFLH